MTSTVVKCKSCNIVICEVLAFVQNKLSVLDEVSLSKICTTGFSDKDISEAKTLLFHSVPTKKRKVLRKGDGKSEREIDDIIEVLKDIDPDQCPIFVAKELHKLPPVTFESIDVTRLLKDIVLLQNEVKCIKENYVSAEQVNKMLNELENKMSPSSFNNFECNINAKRGTLSRFNTNCNYDSGPIGLTHVLENDLNLITINTPQLTTDHGSLSQRVNTQINDIGHNKNNEGILPTCNTLPSPPLSAAAEKIIDVRMQPVYESPTRGHSDASVCVQSKERIAVSKSPCTTTQRQLKSPATNICEKIVNNSSNRETLECMFTCNTFMKSMAETVREKGEWKSEKASEEWKMVQKKRYKNRFVPNIGKAQTKNYSNFKAADNKIQLFISYVHKETTEKDISDYIYEKTRILVKLEKINMVKEKGHNSFKFLVPCHKQYLFFNDNLWPEGIAFRRFVPLYKRTEQEKPLQGPKI